MNHEHKLVRAWTYDLLYTVFYDSVLTNRFYKLWYVNPVLATKIN